MISNFEFESSLIDFSPGKETGKFGNFLVPEEKDLDKLNNNPSLVTL